MPLYEYLCQDCNARFTKLRPVAERSLPTRCPFCSSERTEPVISRVSALDSGCQSSGRGFT